MNVSCRYLFLLAVSLVYNIATGDNQIQKSPLACRVDGKQYPLYAKWPSTTPGECAEYTCVGTDSISGLACPLMHVKEDPNITCYDISVEDAPYPYCCTVYHCVERNETSTSPANIVSA